MILVTLRNLSVGKHDIDMTFFVEKSEIFCKLRFYSIKLANIYKKKKYWILKVIQNKAEIIKCKKIS